jgi:hypothetical protein
VLLLSSLKVVLVVIIKVPVMILEPRLMLLSVLVSFLRLSSLLVLVMRVLVLLMAQPSFLLAWLQVSFQQVVLA